jgi:hypothetical protein
MAANSKDDCPRDEERGVGGLPSMPRAGEPDLFFWRVVDPSFGGVPALLFVRVCFVGGGGGGGALRQKSSQRHFACRSKFSFSSLFFSNVARYLSYESLKCRSTRDENINSPRGFVDGGIGAIGLGPASGWAEEPEPVL